MSAVFMDHPAPCAPCQSDSCWSRQIAASGVAVGVHVAVLALLMVGWQGETPSAPQVRTLTTQLVALTPPALAAPPQVEPAPPAPVEPPKPLAPSRPVEPPKPAPRLEQQKLEQAALARKRVQEQKQHEQQRIERQQREQQRRETDELAQRQERQRLDEVAARTRAEAAANAAAERARAEAAAAASRQYLPIAKQAPDYPDSALDKGIEGDCTVSYRVNPQGRVEDPQVIGNCHPLFVRPSLAAARSFRYQPRIVDGRAVAVLDVKNTFHYRIQE